MEDHISFAKIALPMTFSSCKMNKLARFVIKKIITYFIKLTVLRERKNDCGNRLCRAMQFLQTSNN